MATSLHDIIEGIYLESQDINSIFRFKKRYLISRYASIGLKELNMTFATHIGGMNIVIPSSCKVYKPDNYESFVRAYLIDCDGRTIEIKKNNKIPDFIHHYLLNCDGSTLDDCTEESLYDDCLVCNKTMVDDSGCVCSNCGGSGRCLSPESAFLLGALEKYKDSWIKTKDSLDYFEFSPDLEGLSVIIEYLTNNTLDIDQCEVVVEDNIKNALEYFIKFKLLESDINFMNQSQYYYRKFTALRTKAKVSENALTKTDLISLFFKK